jgi:hypothetical protein
MLQVFYVDVAYVCNCFSCIFACVSGTYFEYFSCVVRMLQLFHLDVLKSRSGCCACCNVRATCHSCLLQLLRRRAWRGAAQQAWKGAREVGKRGGVARVGPAYEYENM